MIDMESVKQDRDESVTARVERAQQAVERTLTLVAASQDALIRATAEMSTFEVKENDGRKVLASDAAETDLIGSTIEEMMSVSFAVLRIATRVSNEAFDAILHNSGRMQYWLERETPHGKQ